MLSASNPPTPEREIELAWAAGFYDGEGYTSYHARTFSLRVEIGQKNRSTLERFQSAIGGLGEIAFRPKSTGREYWSLSVYGRVNVLTVFRLMAPYLSPPKTMQFLDALRAANDREYSRRRSVDSRLNEIVGL